MVKDLTLIELKEVLELGKDDLVLIIADKASIANQTLAYLREKSYLCHPKQTFYSYVYYRYCGWHRLG